ncbi:MAG: ATP-binding protein [Methylophilales bacterium]|nr:ATP-binding protein [Methylophilales bacterium]
MPDFDALVSRAEQVLVRLENLLPQAQPEPDWNALAWRWRKKNGQGFLQAVTHPHHLQLQDFLGIEDQKKTVVQNTRQFVQGLPANNVLLTGARGTGKSSLVKALLTEFSAQGLRLVEMDKQDLTDLHDLTDLLRSRPEKFIVFCDDLSFDANEPGYKALKVALDGSVSGVADNMLIYATSNRRNLMPEFMKDNLDTDDIRPGETVDEKVALSERFGVWLSFYAFDQDEYLAIVASWLKHFGIRRMTPKIRHAALQWSHMRGARSGRVAWQFARDWSGKQKIQ